MADQVHYDEEIIQQFAGRLYARARSLVVVYALGGLVLGAVAWGAMHNANFNDVLGVIVFVAAIGVAAGLGTEKGFALKLQAQQALCQAQIERNTRGANGVASASVKRTERPPSTRAEY